jgi:hypothetical protein
MFKLGKYIRKRYENFLGTSPREVHIRSSAADRCLESAALVLAAIYPPEGRYQYFIFNSRKNFLTKKSNKFFRWQWNTELGKSWQPFPIQTEPLPFDGVCL